MSNAIALPNDLFQPTEYANDESFAMVAKGGGFFPFIILGQALTGPVQNGEMKQGEFGLVQGQGMTNILSLTTEFNALPFAWRPKAIFIDPATKKVKSWFDPVSQKDYFIKAEVEQERTPKSGWMYGPEYFFYLPEYNKFAVMHFNNKTLRTEAGKLRPFIAERKPITMKSYPINSGGNKWFGAMTLECTTAITMPANDTPEYEAWYQQAVELTTKFRKPPKAIEEEAVESTEAQPQRAR